MSVVGSSNAGGRAYRAIWVDDDISVRTMELSPPEDLID